MHIISRLNLLFSHFSNDPIRNYDKTMMSPPHHRSYSKCSGFSNQIQSVLFRMNMQRIDLVIHKLVFTICCKD